MKSKKKIIEEAANRAIEALKKEVDSKRDKIIERLKLQSIHKNEFVIQADAHYFLDEEFTRYRE